MFTEDDVKARLKATPFIPFEIVTTTGEGYHILHPDFVLTARRFVVVGLPRIDQEDRVEQVTHIANSHIAELRDLPIKTLGKSGN
jgi:hypothetical protein